MAQSPSPSSVKSLSNGALKGTLLADASGTSRNSQNAEQIPQAASEAQTFQLDETVVTATGYEQELRYAPATISIITKDEISKRPIQDLGDVVEEVPGVILDRSKTGMGQISIRGMSADNTLILIDGKRSSPTRGMDSNGYNSASGYMPPLSMIERVEVIKGPSSLMYGNDAMGGVVNIITKKKVDETTANITLNTRLQEHNDVWGHTYGFNGSVFTPLTETLTLNLRGKVNIQEENHFYKNRIDGYVCIPSMVFDTSGVVLPGSNGRNNCGNPYVGGPPEYRVAGAGARLTYTPNEQNTFYFDADYSRQRIGALVGSPMSITEHRNYERVAFVFNHEGNYDFGKFNSYLQYNQVTQVTDHYRFYDGERYIAGHVGYGRDHNTLLFNPVFSAGSVFTTNFDFGKAGGLILNVGPSFLWERTYDRSYENSNLTGYQVALFAEGEYLPLEWMGLTAGARLNYVDEYGAHISPRAYLSFYPTDWLVLKGGVATGFQAPDLKMRFGNGRYEYGEYPYTYYYGNSDLKYETSINYEINAIADSPIGVFDIGGYITDYKDKMTQFRRYQSPTVLPGGYVCEATEDWYCSVYENVGKSRLWGAEFSFKSKAILSSLFTQWGGGIYFDLSYAYRDSVQKTGTDEGKPLNYIHKHTLIGRLAYRTQKWELYTRYKGAMRLTTDNLTVGSGYSVPRFYRDTHIVDLGTNYRFDGGVLVGFVINNLLDVITTEDYFRYGTSSFANRYGAGSFGASFIPSRSYWLTISVDF